MWNPQLDGIKELSKLFKESKGKDNAKHKDIFAVNIL